MFADVFFIFLSVLSVSLSSNPETKVWTRNMVSVTFQTHAVLVPPWPWSLKTWRFTASWCRLRSETHLNLITTKADRVSHVLLFFKEYERLKSISYVFFFHKLLNPPLCWRWFIIWMSNAAFSREELTSSNHFNALRKNFQVMEKVSVAKELIIWSS